jgi:hypothetical protein
MNAITKTGKTLLNALAFANVDNLSEFRALLNQVGAPASLDHAPTQQGAMSSSSSHSPVAPVIQPIQGAL